MYWCDVLEQAFPGYSFVTPCMPWLLLVRSGYSLHEVSTVTPSTVTPCTQWLRLLLVRCGVQIRLRGLLPRGSGGNPLQPRRCLPSEPWLPLLRTVAHRYACQGYSFWFDIGTSLPWSYLDLYADRVRHSPCCGLRGKTCRARRNQRGCLRNTLSAVLIISMEDALCVTKFNR